MEQAHSTKTSTIHHQRGPDMETPREEKEAMVEKYLADRPPGGYQEDASHLIQVKTKPQGRGL